MKETNLISAAYGVCRRCTGRGFDFVLRWVQCGVANVMRASGVVVLLRLIIVVELCVLGVGVVRRLENSYDQAMEAARMELAVLEAQELQQEENGAGSAGIGATDIPAQDADEGTAVSREAPELRPRDVADIISDETGDLDAAAAVMERETGVSSEQAETQQQQNPSGTLSAEDHEEVDELIRQGVAAMISGDMKRCVLSLEQATTLSPDHPALLYYYGMAYDKLLNPRKARDYYSKLFRMREQAGKYFQLASRRLTFGMELPSALRGKLAFGPHRIQHTYDTEQGENVSIMLPVMLAPGERIRPDDIYITIQFFDLVNGRKIDFSRITPKLSWTNEKPTWNDCEEDLMVQYNVPQADGAEAEGVADVKYYGFTAKLYYQGEPLDCISSPSALILHEQRLNSRRRGLGPGGLLPDDGLSPYAEEAVPYADEMDESRNEYL